jgi:hypothetical protein
VSFVSFWSDGSAAQFKNRFMFSSLVMLKSLYNINIQWSFFATSHGKGPCDALGGTAKRVVCQRILTQKAFVVDAKTFQEVLTNSGSKIKCTLVCEQEMEKAIEFLGVNLLWQKVKVMPGVQNTHHVIPAGQSVKLKFYNFAENAAVHGIGMIETPSLAVELQEAVNLEAAAGHNVEGADSTASVNVVVEGSPSVVAETVDMTAGKGGTESCRSKSKTSKQGKKGKNGNKMVRKGSKKAMP